MTISYGGSVCEAAFELEILLALEREDVATLENYFTIWR